MTLKADSSNLQKLKQRFQALFRVATSVNHVASLNARQIYILPSRWSIFYILMLLALLIGAINYTLSLAYFVTFLLASLANVAILHTWRNLAYLEISAINNSAVFAGDITHVNIKIREIKNRTRYVIFSGFANNIAITNTIKANESCTYSIPLMTSKRGSLPLPKLKVYTTFPLNLFHAWAVVELNFNFIVYPKPSDTQRPISSTIDPDNAGSKTANTSNDDFIGHKTYQIGDLPSKVDWKASSRGIGMFSKQYAGEANETILFHWAQTKGDKETRISQLTRSVIDAHAARQMYGLYLNDQVKFTPDNSVAHYHSCLKALALA
jgi:uncharacterized protein (DUF58 family)